MQNSTSTTHKSHCTGTAIYISVAVVGLTLVLAFGIGVPLMINNNSKQTEEQLNIERGNVGTFLRDKVLGFSKNVLTFVGTFFGGDIHQDDDNVLPTETTN